MTKPARTFFYGWVMAGIAVLMAIATMPGQTVLVALFNASYRETFGLSVTALSAAYTAGTILAAVPLPWVGHKADRHGLRKVVGIVALGFALSLCYISVLSGGGLGALLALGLGFFLIRFLGQGSLGMLAGHTIAMWFERKLGTVHAILAIAGFALGSAILPQPTAWLIAEVGWRTTLLILAGLVAILTLPPLLFFKNKPEDIGQHLDGDPTEHETHDVAHGGPPPPGDPAFTVKQALRTPAYWIVAANMVASGLIGTAVIFHMGSMLTTAGLEGTEQQAARAIQPWPIAFGLATLLAGPLADRVHPRMLLPIAPLLTSGACLVFILASRAEPNRVVLLMGTGMAVFALGQALVTAVGNPVIARYFGRTNHGAIRGTISTATVAGTGAGPFLAGYWFELAGDSFTPVLIAFATGCVPLAIAAFWLKPPANPVPVS